MARIEETGEQLSIFDFIEEPFKITKPIRLIELFAGIGSQAMALKAIGATFESWKVIEVDKRAVRSYNAIHGTKYSPTDIKKVKGWDLEIIDTDSFVYLMTYSFPCVDLSLAGTKYGFKEGSGTRSSLLWEVKRILEETSNLPQVLLMENVTQIHNEKNRGSFKAWLKFLESKGYKNFWKDLNSKDYGVAQSRKRTIMVSFLGDGWFKFPKPHKLKKKMSDYLETDVESKYFLSDRVQKMLIEDLILNGRKEQRPDQNLDVEVLGGIGEKKSHNGTQYYQQHRVYNKETICPALNSSGTELVPKILDTLLIRQATDTGFVECKVHGVADLNFPKSNSRRGRVIKGGEISPTITTHNVLNVLEDGSWSDGEYEYLVKIRFLTPRECWRLMDFSDEDFDKVRPISSDRRLYMQAGNSIVKNVLCEVFKQLIESRSDQKEGE